MSGYVKHFVGREYQFGDYKASGATETGKFVTIDHADKEFDVPAGDAIGDLYFVANENDPLVPHNQDYRTTAVASGDFVKAKPVIDKEVFITTNVGSTYDTVAVGDTLGVGTGGELFLIADLTASDFTTFQTVFVVTAKVKLWGLDAIIVEANTNQKTA